ncbi:MAG: bifunctional diguanylate cyclase/phosphodiesterase [Ilumatobacteraceae bacterium]
MPTTSPASSVTHRWLNAYIALVAVTAVALTAWVLAKQPGLVAPGKLTYVLIFSGLLFISETRNAWLKFGDGGEVTHGWAFAFSIVLLGSPFIAIASMSLCTLWVDLRERKAVNRVIFNVAQITASLAAGALSLQLFGLTAPLTDAGSPSSGFALAILASGALVFIANGMLTCVVLAIHHKTSVRSTMGRSFFLSISADGALLALSPIFVVAITFSLYMLPLLGVTALLIYQSTQQALKRAHEADHDDLTGLLNRRAFDQHLTGFIDSNRDLAKPGVVVLLDLDGFKEINDRLGHHTGDLVLQGIATQLTASAPEASVIARLGGDEFALLIPAIESTSSIMVTAEHLRGELTRPIEVGGFPLSVGVSMGLALIPRDGRTAEEALGAADIAMYRAKRFRTGVEMYKTIGSRAEKGRLGLLGELSRAQATDQLQIHYQPMTRFIDGAPVGIEALLRWQHPTLGNIPPADFITLAEHTDLIGPLTQFVLDRATSDAHALEMFDVRISINVSARNLQDRRFPAGVFRALEQAGIDPTRLELEITESAIAREPERSLFAITGLREAGIRVAIDDFGTGYSSFAMLRDFPVDRLKIDASFVSGINGSPRQQHLVGAIVGLAHGLNIDVVAEGVETEESWQTLAELGCEVAQGFLICRPLPLPDLVDWLDLRQSMSAMENVVAS